MRVYLSVILAGTLLAIAGQQTAWAQSAGRSLGGSISPGRSSSSGGTSFGSRSGLGSAGGFGATTTGQVQGSERFIRGSRQPGEFVGGGDSGGGTTGFVGAASGARTSGNRSTRGLSSAANRGGNQSRRSSRSSRNEVRAHVRLSFTVVRPAATDIVPRLQVQLEKIIHPKASSPIQIEVQKGTAILRGAVASAHDRAIAERLVLLEGGIWKVKNELTVSESENPPSPK